MATSLTHTHTDWKRNPTKMIQLRENTKGSSSTSSFRGFEYDVFLSFRGADTRHKFTSFLHDQLVNAGFEVYKDDEKLRAGEEILPSLMKAIGESRLSIPIFSPDYASSKSCLHEVAEMNKCRSTIGQIVLPIFYEIEPSDVRHQTGPFEEPFHQHQKDGVDSHDLDQWKKALQEIGFLKGYPVGPKVDQSKLVKEIVSAVMDRLETCEVPVEGDLVGMEQRVDAVIERLHISSGGVRVVGICGMAGIGKTTLAETVYNELHHRFDCCSFIYKIREGDILSLQTRLISRLKGEKFERLDSCEASKRFIKNRFTTKKVLIVLDDVDNREHLKAFGVGLQCFGAGSRIILTTRDPEHLVGHEIAEWYQVDGLSTSDALKHFCRHAFKKDIPEEGYTTLSLQIVLRVGGNPLFIQLAGSRLYNIRDKSEWEEVLQQLDDCNDPDMRKLLKKIYDDLTEEQRQVCLDIACFLRGESHIVASYMWHDCKFYPITARKKLVGMSLLTIGENDEMLMNYPISKYGEDLVVAEHMNPEMRSRIWKQEDALKVLEGKKGSDEIKAMCLQLDNGSETSPLLLMADNFASLSELRFLRLDRAKISGNFEKFLPNLRWLDWKNCPQILDEVQNLYLEKLVILDMSCSNVTQEWRGWKPIREKATNLKVLQLAECNHLHKSPSFPEGRQLERLDFEGCSHLGSISVPSSTVKTLVYLNIKGCSGINKLPEDLSSMVALETLIIDGTSIKEISFRREMKKLKKLSACACKYLNIIDNSIGELESLSHLALDETGIDGLPDSIGSLPKLQTLSLRKCQKVEKLPHTIGQLTSLVKLDLSDTIVGELQSEVEGLKSLHDLVMARTYLSAFPENIAELKSLKNIDFSGCGSMEGDIPNSITDLSSLKSLMLSATNISSLPKGISQLSQLQVLDLYRCKKLHKLPTLPAGLSVRRPECRTFILL